MFIYFSDRMAEIIKQEVDAKESEIIQIYKVDSRILKKNYKRGASVVFLRGKGENIRTAKLFNTC